MYGIGFTLLLALKKFYKVMRHNYCKCYTLFGSRESKEVLYAKVFFFMIFKISLSFIAWKECKVLRYLKVREIMCFSNMKRFLNLESVLLPKDLRCWNLPCVAKLGIQVLMFKYLLVCFYWRMNCSIIKFFIKFGGWEICKVDWMGNVWICLFLIVHDDLSVFPFCVYAQF